MARRYLVLALGLVLALAVAVPVLATTDRAVTPNVVSISKRALAKSQVALDASRAAKRGARLATEAAGAAQGTAAAASAAAGEANAAAGAARTAASATEAALDSTRMAVGTAAGEVTTSSGAYVALVGGPSVTVTVPASGLIEVWAQAYVLGKGAVSLFEDGDPVPGQNPICGPDESVGALFAFLLDADQPVAVGTPAVINEYGCGAWGAPGPVLFETIPGTHTYELRYATCGCQGGAESAAFSQRRLYVAPRL